jgi:hypothetical protein
MLSVVFNYYFINYYFTTFRKNRVQTLFLLFYASKVPFAKFVKFYWKILFYVEIMFATILKCYFKFYKTFAIGMIQLESNLKRI